MVTAILPTMTVVKIVEDPRSPTRHANGASHALAPSISSELTITPARFHSSDDGTDENAPAKKDTVASTSHLAGLVGVFTGCGALVALLISLDNHGGRQHESFATSIATIMYLSRVKATYRL